MNRRIKVSTVIVVLMLIIYGLSDGFSTFGTGTGYNIVYGRAGIERVSSRTGSVKVLFESDHQLYFVEKGNTIYVAEKEKLFAVDISGKSRRLVFEGDGCIVPSDDTGLVIKGRYIYFAQDIDGRLIHGRLNLRKLEFEQVG